MRIELGGGVNPRDGFVNVDKLDVADVQCDFENLPLPFDDDSVNELYSSHCFEHVLNVHPLVGDVLRICKIGCQIEWRFPHWLHPFAMSPGHYHVLSARQVRYWCDDPRLFWPKTRKRFVMTREPHYQIEVDFNELRELFPQLNEEQVAKYIPGCCHEVHYHLTVEPLDTGD